MQKEAGIGPFFKKIPLCYNVGINAAKELDEHLKV